MQSQGFHDGDYRETMAPAFEASASHHYPNVLAMVLAGGKGERLYPLTGHRAKPAVPFGGAYRLIDFVLSNMVNSAIPEIHILTQYKDHSLLRHLQRGWIRPYSSAGPLIIPDPAQKFSKETCYLGTADAVYKNRSLIKRAKPDLVLVFGSDHVYRMDVRQMISYHQEKGAEVTVATIPMPLGHCTQFGTVVVDDDWQIRQFKEKVPFPTPLPERPDHALVSMGNYIFNADCLLEMLEEDAHDSGSGHDFGRDILPTICAGRRVYAYDFQSNWISDAGGPDHYWRDVGTIESYYRAHMDLHNHLCNMNLDDPVWPLRSIYDGPTARMREALNERTGCIENSIVGNDTIVSGGYVRNSVIGNNVYISRRAVIEESVILGDVIVGEGARIHRAIIDHGNVIEAGEGIGYEPDYDAARYYLDDSGIVVVPYHSLCSTQRVIPRSNFQSRCGALCFQ